MINLKRIIENFVTSDDKDLVSIVENIVNKIDNLPSGTKTTIEKLIDYNPQKSFVDPLTQGIVYNYVKVVCKELNIQLEQHNDDFGGLAYFYAFTKL